LTHKIRVVLVAANQDSMFVDKLVVVSDDADCAINVEASRWIMFIYNLRIDATRGFL